jgi:hypothetical protein
VHYLGAVICVSLARWEQQLLNEAGLTIPSGEKSWFFAWFSAWFSALRK